MEDYFVLTFSSNCDIETAADVVKTLSTSFPEKTIIALPDTISLKIYSKEEIINLLEFYIDFLKKVSEENE